VENAPDAPDGCDGGNHTIRSGVWPLNIDRPALLLDCAEGGFRTG
jgi:hypothetical protein